MLSTIDIAVCDFLIFMFEIIRTEIIIKILQFLQLSSHLGQTKFDEFYKLFMQRILGMRSTCFHSNMPALT